MVIDAMYRVMVVENEQEQADAVAWMLDRFPRSQELSVEYVANANELKHRFASGDYADILFMDIELGLDSPNGIEAVQNLLLPRCGTQVIYITGHIEYCTKVYRTDHVYFLAKPAEQCDFDDALNKALGNLEALARDPLGVHIGGKTVRVFPHKISHIESVRRKVKIYTSGATLETYSTMVDLTRRLPSNFIQCHKSFLVNMDYIQEFGKEELLLISGASIPIGQKRRKAAREEFFSYLKKHL